jgi:hypothetical protein
VFLQQNLAGFVVNRSVRRYEPVNYEKEDYLAMKTRITIDEEGMEKPLLERIEQGEVRYSANVRAVELQKMMLENADEWMLYDMVLKDDPESFIETAFRFAQEQTSIDADKLIGPMITFITEQAEDHLVRDLLVTLCKQWEVSRHDVSTFNRLLTAMLFRLKEISEPSVLLEFLRTLLEKAHVYDSPDLEVIKTVLSAVAKRVKEFEAQETIEELWTYMCSLMSKKAILEVAKPHLHELELISPVLPRNCLFYKAGMGGNNEVIALEMERVRWDVRLGENMFEQIGHPKLVFVFHLYQGEVKGAFVAAVKDEVITKRTKLYYYPFSNVYDSMKCCWNFFPELKERRHIETYPSLFLSGERNFDLYQKLEGMEYRELLTILSGQDFNDDWLKDTGKTLEHFM